MIDNAIKNPTEWWEKWEGAVDALYRSLSDDDQEREEAHFDERIERGVVVNAKGYLSRMMWIFNMISEDIEIATVEINSGGFEVTVAEPGAYFEIINRLDKHGFSNEIYTTALHFSKQMGGIYGEIILGHDETKDRFRVCLATNHTQLVQF